ncbi:hypothetical protein VCJ_000732 [Vibrio metoecus]|nr:hypothetical protein VCJ_000732 [Vibrio metoecus]
MSVATVQTTWCLALSRFRALYRFAAKTRGYNIDLGLHAKARRQTKLSAARR